MDVSQPRSPDNLKELLSGIDPDLLRRIVPPLGTITIMFTDIVDSTRVKREVGDEIYFRVLELHNALVRNWLTRCNGTELRTIGDAFFVIFADPREAVDCAIQIQQALVAKALNVGSESIRVRIGLHTGTPKIFFDRAANRNDLSGTDADKAARVESLARGGQVLISEETCTLAKPPAVHDWGLWELKGLGSQRIFEVLYPGKNPETPIGRMQLETVRFATAFVGRERELRELTEVVKGHRLVTVTGIGGIGKTRLADAVARRLSDAFEDGTFFIELATVTDQALASELAARLAVNLKGFKDETEALLSTLRNRHSLLVLDNFEHLASTALLVGRLSIGCPGLYLLITSQVPLNLEGEQIYTVPLMDQPPPTVDSKSLGTFDVFRLFCERAHARKRDWEIATPADADAVVEILQLTEGVPLSLEFAAAAVGSQTLEEIKNGLEANKLEFLKSRHIDRDPRHASIRASLDYSFGLLTDECNRLLPQLSVFMGGFFADDVEAVCGLTGAAQLLIVLQERNFVVWQQALGQSRYSMLTTVREFAAGRLDSGAAERLKHVHAEYFLAVLASAAEQLKTNQYTAALERLDADLGNLEEGVRTSQKSGEYPVLMGYALQLADYLSIRGRFADRMRLALATRDAAEALGPRGIADAEHSLADAYAELPIGDRADNLRLAIDHYQAALRFRTERNFPVDWAQTQTNLGIAYWNLPTGNRRDNLRRAIDCYQAALRVRTERDFPYQWALTQTNLGNAFTDIPAGNRGDDLRRAIDCYQGALRVWTKRDFPRGWATIQTNLGAVYSNLRSGDPSNNLRLAMGCCEAALQVWTERDFPRDWALTENNLGFAYANLPGAERGDNLRRAIDCYQAALRVRTERDFPRAWALTQHNLGAAYADLPGDRGDNLRRAIDCYEAALRVQTERELPQEWALTQEKLGAAYNSLPTGKPGDNRRCAIAHYEDAARGFLAVGMTDEADNVRTMTKKVMTGLGAERTLGARFHNVLQKFRLFRRYTAPSVKSS